MKNKHQKLVQNNQFIHKILTKKESMKWVIGIKEPKENRAIM